MIWSGLIGNYEGNMKSKEFNRVLPYVYFLKRKSDNLKYIGSRYLNIREGISPEDDFGIRYFTSGKLKEEFKSDPSKFEYRLLYTFSSPEEALSWEEVVVKSIMGKKGWANLAWANNFSHLPDIGERISKGKNKVRDCGKTSIEVGSETLSSWIWNTPEGESWRKDISLRQREVWSNRSEEEIKAITSKRKESMDFYTSSRKRADKMLSTINDEGLNVYQVSARKGIETRRKSGQLSRNGSSRNEKFNEKLCLMSEEDFKTYCENRSPRIIKGWETRRRKYSHLYVTNTD